MATDLGAIIRRIDDLNRTCWRLRQAYLERHPQAPRTRQEQEYRRLRQELEAWQAQRQPDGR